MFNNITSRKTGFPDSSPADEIHLNSVWRAHTKIISARLPRLIFLGSKPASGEQQENNFHVRARRLDFITVSFGEREEKFPPP